MNYFTIEFLNDKKKKILNLTIKQFFIAGVSYYCKDRTY